MTHWEARLPVPSAFFFSVTQPPCSVPQKLTFPPALHETGFWEQGLGRNNGAAPVLCIGVPRPRGGVRDAVELGCGGCVWGPGLGAAADHCTDTGRDSKVPLLAFVTQRIDGCPQSKPRHGCLLYPMATVAPCYFRDAGGWQYYRLLHIGWAKPQVMNILDLWPNPGTSLLPLHHPCYPSPTPPIWNLVVSGEGSSNKMFVQGSSRTLNNESIRLHNQYPASKHYVYWWADC